MQPNLVAGVPDPKPWIGSAYLTQPIRTLVIGESHKMSNDEPGPTGGVDLELYTMRTLTWWICSDNSSPFFSGVERSMAGDVEALDGEYGRTARSDFWHSIAFANFVPAVMPGQDTSPNDAQWRAGTPRFIKLLDALEPTLICLFTKQAYNHYIPWGEAPNYDGLGAEPKEVENGLIRYERSRGEITHMLVFPHASRGSANEARRRYEDFRVRYLNGELN